jgi:hypothetical protein
MKFYRQKRVALYLFIHNILIKSTFLQIKQKMPTHFDMHDYIACKSVQSNPNQIFMSNN